MTTSDWYERVNATWPTDVPVLTGEEAVRAGRRLYRFALGRTFRGPVRVTSGNRYTWIRRGEMTVNPEKGWHGLVHLLSHYAHQRLHPKERPHSRVHARLEIRMIKEVIRRGWLDGKLKGSLLKPSKPNPTALDKLDALTLRERRWQSKLKRAATALRKLARQRRALEKKAAHDLYHLN